MSYALHVVRAGDFVRSGPEGTFDLAQSCSVLEALAEALVARGIHKALLDVRRMRVEPPTTYTQLYNLARCFRDAGFGPKHRLAVLVSPDQHDKADFFALCASSRGWNAYAFDDFEEAFDWLAEETPIAP